MTKTKVETIPALGSPRNPQVVGTGHRVLFAYAPGNSFEVTLQTDGSLQVRTSGDYSDIIATHHHVANSCILVARRYSDELGRYVDFVVDERPA